MRLITLILILSSLLFAERIVLKTGEVITGKIIGYEGDLAIVKTSYGEIKIEKDKISKIEYETLPKEEPTKPEEPKSIVMKRGYQLGYSEGKLEGSRKSASDWMMIGCGSGFLFGCLGGGIATVIGYSSGDTPVTIPKGDDEYSKGFVEGYRDATKSKKGSSALVGGIIGTLSAAAIIFIILVSTGE
ncbi:MAG TPA: hypothetical protein EYP58_00810 [bacterium (Candidatus Stahlbacteria)]|nr:hypothetical protein [Candidatus Stahlbacteria bacterium]